MASTVAVSPATLSNFLKPLIDGNSWLQYDYKAGVNGQQIAVHKKFVQAVAMADGIQSPRLQKLLSSLFPPAIFFDRVFHAAADLGGKPRFASVRATLEPSAFEAEPSLDVPYGKFKSAYEILSQDKELHKTGKLKFKNSHGRQTWIKEMVLRSRGIIGNVVKYRRRAKWPDWMEKLQLSRLPAADGGAEEMEDEECAKGESIDEGLDNDGEEGEAGEEEAPEVDEPVDADTAEGKDGDARAPAAPATSDKSCGKRRNKESKADATSAPEYDIGWDAEKRRAWRLPIGAKKSMFKELAFSMKPPADGSKYGAMTALFEDGAEYQVPVTLEEFEGAVAPLAGGKGRGRAGGRGRGLGRDAQRGAASSICFKGNMDDDVAEVHLRCNDRKMQDGTVKVQRLCCIKFKGRQLIQIDTKHFKNNEAMSEYNVQNAAVAFMNDLCQKFVTKELTLDQLQERKKTFLESKVKGASDKEMDTGETKGNYHSDAKEDMGSAPAKNDESSAGTAKGSADTTVDGAKPSGGAPPETPTESAGQPTEIIRAKKMPRPKPKQKKMPKCKKAPAPPPPTPAQPNEVETPNAPVKRPEPATVRTPSPKRKSPKVDVPNTHRHLITPPRMDSDTDLD
jgi:hypothetical protein